MSILVEGGTVLTLDNQDGVYERADILIEGDQIAQIASRIDQPDVERVVHAADLLVMPGLNIAHAHSNESLFKGAIDQYPLELWLLYSFPPADWSIPSEIIYPRTILNAAEMIKAGATTVQDDVPLMVSPHRAHEQMDAIFQAYSDIGMRVSLMIDMLDKSFEDQFPFLSSSVPTELLKRFDESSDWRAEEFIELSRYTIDQWHEPEGRLRFALSPSGPQWCTDDFMLLLDEISREHTLPIHTHLLESKLQAVHGQELYGKSVVQHLDDLGLLSPRMTLAHCIWVSDDDVRLMADAQVSVVHNPASNMKLGSGLMPLRAIFDSGCNVALGVDGAASNDSQNPFEMMKMTALLHRISHSDPELWPTSDEVLRMATIGGARSELIGHQVGALAEGMKADMILVQMNNVHFTTLENLKDHLVFSETGGSVHTSIINGRIVMEDRKIVTTDVDKSLEQVRSLMPSIRDAFEAALKWSNQAWPYMEVAYAQSAKTPLAMNRWTNTEQYWLQ